MHLSVVCGYLFLPNNRVKVVQNDLPFIPRLGQGMHIKDSWGETQGKRGGGCVARGLSLPWAQAWVAET